MSARKRFYGPVLTAVGSQSAFAGTEEKERMDLVRNAIYNVRTKWRKLEEHEFLRTQIREFTERQPTRHPPELRAELDRLLQHFNDYADMDHGGELPVTADASSFTALEIYCSKDGYEYLYSLISKLLRAREVDPQQLITAATLVEYLTIELYNLRLSNIGHDMYANYQGIVYRGMSVATAAAEDFRKIANNPNLAERNFAIPLALISSTTDVKTMEKFAATDPTKEQMHWTIHIHGLDPVLLDRYLQKYPSSVVTSLCAMPIAGISPLGEKEILLRGPFFHIIHMASELGDDKRIIHKLEVVMLNSNRDHGTELGSNEGEKGQQRAFFNRIIKASRYEICASLAEKYSIEDARGYERLMQETLAQIDADDVRQPTVSTGLAEARSSGVATWLGASCSCTFPRHHASRRKKWQEAAGTGDWETIESILQDNYEWHRTEWLNAIELTEHPQGKVAAGHTLLHRMATLGPPPEDNQKATTAWRCLIEEIKRSEAWLTQRTLDENAMTAQQLAEQSGHEDLIRLFEPSIKQPLPDREAAAKLESQLHELIKRQIAKQTDDTCPCPFVPPQLSVMTEMEKPKLWVPIPRSYGGFLLALQGGALDVCLFETVVGQTRPKQTSFTLRAELQEQ